MKFNRKDISGLLNRNYLHDKESNVINHHHLLGGSAGVNLNLLLFLGREICNPFSKLPEVYGKAIVIRDLYMWLKALLKPFWVN